MSALPSKKDQPDFISKKIDDVPSESKTLSDGDRSFGIDWSNVTSSQIDWSQPVVRIEEEPLTLDWGEENDSALEEEEEDAIGLVMKSTDVGEKDRQEDQKTRDPNVLSTPQEEDHLKVLLVSFASKRSTTGLKRKLLPCMKYVIMNQLLKNMPVKCIPKETVIF